MFSFRQHASAGQVFPYLGIRCGCVAKKKWELKALTCALLHILELIVKFGSLHSGDALCHELICLVQLLLKPRERKGRHLE
jgi:hypothetical protein